MTPIVKDGKCRDCGKAINNVDGLWKHQDDNLLYDHEAEPAPPEAPKCGSGTKPWPEASFKKEQLRLEQFRCAVENRLGLLDMHTASNVSSLIDHAAQEMVFQVVAYFNSKKHIERVEEKTRTITVTLSDFISVPTSWWQHFKSEWFPKWALERWPVQLREFRVHRSEKIDVHVVENHIVKVCPHTKYDKDRTHFEWLASRSAIDEFNEKRILFRLKAFLYSLVSQNSEFRYDCSNRVIEEAERLLKLDGKDGF